MHEFRHRITSRVSNSESTAGLASDSFQSCLRTAARLVNQLRGRCATIPPRMEGRARTEEISKSVLDERYSKKSLTSAEIGLIINEVMTGGSGKELLCAL